MVTVEELANRLRICDEAHNWEATWNDLATTALLATLADPCVEWSIRLVATGKRIRVPDAAAGRLVVTLLHPKAAVVESRLTTEWAT